MRLRNSREEPVMKKAKEFYRQGWFQDAESLFMQVLQDRKRKFGPEHSNTSSSEHWLGRTRYELGKYEEAKALFEHSLRGQEKALGKRHNFTLHSKH
jgi:TolA-binding protein